MISPAAQFAFRWVNHQASVSGKFIVRCAYWRPVLQAPCETRSVCSLSSSRPPAVSCRRLTSITCTGSCHQARACVLAFQVILNQLHEASGHPAFDPILQSSNRKGQRITANSHRIGLKRFFPSGLNHLYEVSGLPAFKLYYKAVVSEIQLKEFRCQCSGYCSTPVFRQLLLKDVERL